jgi:prevent-host-death family protein
MMIIGVSDARTHLTDLLKRASQGETFQITVRGVPVATLVPINDAHNTDLGDVVREIRRLRKGITLGKTSIRQLIDSGRRN